MAIRTPLQTVVSVTDTATTGTASYPFFAPQDIDSVVVKVTAAAFTGTNPTADIYIQTSDDGGTTWYDCANVGQVTAAIVNQNARFTVIPLAGSSLRGLANFVGSVAASTTAAAQTTGLPILSKYCRIYYKYGGTQLANSGITTVVYAPTQSVNL